MRWMIASIGLCTASLSVAAPLTVVQQGRLTDGLGQPLNGSQSVTFALYAAPSGGTSLWSESHPLTLSDGYYSVVLGNQDALDSVVVDGSTRWLGVSVGGTELLPRTAMHAAPYAIQANRVRIATSAPSSCGVTEAGETYFDTTLGQLRVCDGTTWAGTGSSASGLTGTSCRALLDADPNLPDGVYTIDPDGSGPMDAFQTRCDMSGGGWMLLAHSEAEGLTAAEIALIHQGTFADYGQTGFGSPAASSRVFWLALDSWHDFTSTYPSNTWRMVDSRYDMQVRDLTVGDAAGEYVLNYGERVNGTNDAFSGFFTVFRGRRFTTIDNDNDTWSGNCAATNPSPNGGWWYQDCYQHSLFNSDGNMYSWQTNATQRVAFIDVWVREH